MNVLITGCSSFSYELAVDCLRNNEDGLPVKVFGVDFNPAAILKSGLDGSKIICSIHSPNYINELIEYCKEESIDVILPFITAELPLLAANVATFEKEGIKVAISSPSSIAIANDKIEMMRMFPQYMPMQSLAGNIHDAIDFAAKIGYPNNKFCAKLHDKCGGKGFCIIDDEKASDMQLFSVFNVPRHIAFSHLLDVLQKRNNAVILQQYIQGVDYSVCVLADKGKVIQKCGYEGYHMNYGSVMDGMIVKHQEAYDIADEVCAKIGFDGNACFDFMVDQWSKVWLLEVNPRLNATLPFCARAGVNLPFMRCKQLMGYDVSKPVEPEYGLKMDKFYVGSYYV